MKGPTTGARYSLADGGRVKLTGSIQLANEQCVKFPFSSELNDVAPLAAGLFGLHRPISPVVLECKPEINCVWKEIVV